MTKLMTPRLAALAALAFTSGANVDLCAASTRRHATNFGADDSTPANALNIKADFCPHAGGAETMAAMTLEQVSTDIAVVCTAKKARTLNFNGQGSSVKKATCIGIDGYGMASAPAAKTAITIGSGEALGATDEAGVIEFGASYGQGKAPMALVAAAAKKASGSARRQVGSHYVDNQQPCMGELIVDLATGPESGPSWFS